MRVEIEKSRACGSVIAPRSKSMAHRLLICAAMADGESVIRGIEPSDDVLATIDCLKALGVQIERADDVVKLTGIDFKYASSAEKLHCRESGSTLRFFIPLLWLSDNRFTLVGSERLLARPESVYEKIAEEKSFMLRRSAESISVKGKLEGGDYYISGDVSSQFITGLMLALSTLDADSKIIITTAIESKSYIDLTISAMAEFGVRVVWENESTLYIKGSQAYKAREILVEGDYSNAAFLDAFNHIGSQVEVEGLVGGSLQGDRVYKELFERLDEGFSEIDLTDCPDLAPVLFTLAAMKNGAVFHGTRRLKIKESDRAEVMAEELSKFGANISVMDNTVRVYPSELHAPSEILLGHNDHRVVMSLAVISSVYGGVIDGFEAVKKSYPNFFSDIKKLGIECRTYEA